jgi:HK97 family phage major capsid protein
MAQSGYSNIVSRNTTVATTDYQDALVPEPLANMIIQEAPKHSAALSLMHQVRMSSKTQRMPVLDILPNAYFVATGVDTGLKQTADQQWRGVTLVVEEIATIVPVPEAYLADADVPIWDEVMPRMAEAVGALIDGAVFWGTNAPNTWGTPLWTGANTAGNVVDDGMAWNGTNGTTDPSADFAQTVSSFGDMMAQTGYTVNGFAARPGIDWRLIGLRSAQGIPIYQPDLESGTPSGRLYGRNLSMVDNGSWNNEAQVVGGDFSKAIIGIRQDMSFKLFTEGVISNASGVVITNLMQQDAVAMRLVMRLAFAVANPVTIMQPSETIDGAASTVMRWPFGVIAS